MRLVETRLLEGPNVYRLEPVVKLEFAIGRRRTFYGQRDPGRHALVHLGATIPARDWPDGVAAVVAWVRRLRAGYGEGRRGLAVHRSSDPGHWIVTFPWLGAERALTVAEAALALATRDVSPSRTARLTGGQDRLLARWSARLAESRATPPTWIRDADRRVPIVSISGTNGKSTVTRLITHILLRAGRHVGTTTSDGVLVDERMVDPGDWTGPGGAQQILARHDIDVAVLETARGGIVLRGVGYESNEASVLTNVSSDHLDLQGIHTLPELAEVKATICRITRPDGWVVLNADDRLVLAVARRVRARVALFSLAGRNARPIARHLAGGGRAYFVRDGVMVEANGPTESEIVEVMRVPITIGGLAAHNVANALAAAGAARGMGATLDAGPRRPRGLRPGPVALARAAQPVPPGSQGRHRRFRPQRGGARGHPRRRRGDRGRCGRTGGSGHRDHRHGRGSAGRHPAGDRPDRRDASPAGGHQADAPLPARPHARIGRRRAAGRGDRRRHARRRGPDLPRRDAGPAGRAERRARAPRRMAGAPTPRGSSS